MARWWQGLCFGKCGGHGGRRALGCLPHADLGTLGSRGRPLPSRDAPGVFQRPLRGAAAASPAASTLLFSPWGRAALLPWTHVTSVGLVPFLGVLVPPCHGGRAENLLERLSLSGWGLADRLWGRCALGERRTPGPWPCCPVRVPAFLQPAGSGTQSSTCPLGLLKSRVFSPAAIPKPRPRALAPRPPPPDSVTCCPGSLLSTPSSPAGWSARSPRDCDSDATVWTNQGSGQGSRCHWAGGQSHWELDPPSGGDSRVPAWKVLGLAEAGGPCMASPGLPSLAQARAVVSAGQGCFCPLEQCHSHWDN